MKDEPFNKIERSQKKIISSVDNDDGVIAFSLSSLASFSINDQRRERDGSVCERER